MIHLRGNNLYPSALEGVIRRFGEVAEFRVEIDQTAALPALRVEIEPQAALVSEGLVQRIAQAIRDELFFRADVMLVAPGALPRSEMKGQRFVHKPAACV
jgi:phenylacetate-CoA ligase